MPPVACQQEAQGKIRRVLPLYLAVVFAAGALIATQAGVNSQLTRAVGHPVLAATISFMVGTAVLLVGSLGVMGSWTSLAAAAQAPWWAWTGGSSRADGLLRSGPRCRSGGPLREGDADPLLPEARQKSCRRQRSL